MVYPPTNVSSGIPQGKPLSSLLFFLFINSGNLVLHDSQKNQKQLPAQHILTITLSQTISNTSFVKNVKLDVDGKVTSTHPINLFIINLKTN